MVINEWIESKPRWIRPGLRLSLAYLFAIIFYWILFSTLNYFRGGGGGNDYLRVWAVWPTILFFDIDIAFNLPIFILLIFVQALLLFIIGASYGYVVGIGKENKKD